MDRRCRLWWRLHSLALAVPIVLAAALTVLVAGSWAIRSVAVAVGVASLAYVVAMPALRMRIHRWEVTDEAVYTKSGWLTQQWRIAPLSRIQSVDTSRGPLQQLLGLSTVVVTTASAAGSIDISALDAPFAEELVEYLTGATQRTPEDGT